MFFSVKVPLKINGKAYKPCICYELSKVLKPTVLVLKEQGKAVIYEDEVFFCNGKLCTVKPAVQETVPVKETKKETEVSSFETPEVIVKSERKSGKKKDITEGF